MNWKLDFLLFNLIWLASALLAFWMLSYVDWAALGPYHADLQAMAYTVMAVASFVAWLSSLFHRYGSLPMIKEGMIK